LWRPRPFVVSTERAERRIPPRELTAHPFASITPALDEDQAHARLVLLGKGAILAPRLARPLAAESDEMQQSELAAAGHQPWLHADASVTDSSPVSPTSGKPR